MSVWFISFFFFCICPNIFLCCLFLTGREFCFRFSIGEQHIITFLLHIFYRILSFIPFSSHILCKLSELSGLSNCFVIPQTPELLPSSQHFLLQYICSVFLRLQNICFSYHQSSVLLHWVRYRAKYFYTSPVSE